MLSSVCSVDVIVGASDSKHSPCDRLCTSIRTAGRRQNCIPMGDTAHVLFRAAAQGAAGGRAEHSAEFQACMCVSKDPDQARSWDFFFLSQQQGLEASSSSFGAK